MNIAGNLGNKAFNITAPEQMTWEQFFVLYEYYEWQRIVGEHKEGRDILVFSNPEG